MNLMNEESYLKEKLLDIAKEVCFAARTAPKTRGVDVIETAILNGDSILKIIEEMQRIFERTKREAFRKNAESLKNCHCIILLGAKLNRSGLEPCSFCGYKNCDENEKNNAMCAFNIIDLGIAIGSAVSILSDKRIDNRLMWTIGIAAKNLSIFSKEVKQIIGIPLSVSGKNVFFDRK